MTETMDAVEFLGEAKRMCNTIYKYEKYGCAMCPFLGDGCCTVSRAWLRVKDPEETVDFVQTWSKEHPRKTNGDTVIAFIRENLEKSYAASDKRFEWNDACARVIRQYFDDEWWDAEAERGNDA